jgi:hypothetical protein
MLHEVLDEWLQYKYRPEYENYRKYGCSSANMKQNT